MMRRRFPDEATAARGAQLARIVTAEARKAWSDPAYALRRGYAVTEGTQPVAETVFGQPVYADLRKAMLEAVAIKAIPLEWQWAIIETIGADPELVITGHDGRY